MIQLKRNMIIGSVLALTSRETIEMVCYIPSAKVNPPHKYRVFHFEVRISIPRLALGSKSQQILILVRARSIWDFQRLGAKARVMPVDFSDALGVTPVREDTSENDAAADCCLSLAERDVGA
jgi:hypothetical protein